MKPGDLIGGRYRVEQLIGQGGMGAVVSCQDVVLERRVAVKVINRELYFNAELLTRFRREASAAARLRSPHIVTVHDVAVDGDTPYIVYDFLEGRSLEQMVDDGPLPASRAINLIAQACLALTEAHGAGVVHRDIKPGNLVVIDRGGLEHVVVVDFGIAKVSDPSASSTRTGQVMGTPLYMPPEQFQDTKEATAASDIYSLGVTLYYVLSRSHPFVAETLPGLVAAMMTMSPTPLHDKVRVSPALNALVMRCLEKDPRQRFPSAKAMRDALLATPEARGELAARELSSLDANDPFSFDYSATGQVASQTMSPLGSTMASHVEHATLAPREPERPTPWRRGIKWVVVPGLFVVLGFAGVSVAVTSGGAIGLVGVLGGALGVAVGLLAFMAWRNAGRRVGGAKPSPSRAPELTGGSPIALPGYPTDPKDSWVRVSAAGIPQREPSEASVTMGLSAWEELGRPDARRDTVPKSKAAEPVHGRTDGVADSNGDLALRAFVEAAGLTIIGRQGTLWLLALEQRGSLPVAQYAAIPLSEQDLQRTSAPLATAVFQQRASPLYALRGRRDAPVYVIALLDSLPGSGVYREWLTLATEQYVVVLPITGPQLRSVLRRNEAARFLSALVHRAQRSPFDLGGPVKHELDFFGRGQLNELVGLVAGEGASFGVFGLEKWGTTSFMLRLRAELESHVTGWVDVAAVQPPTASAVIQAIGEELGANAGPFFDDVSGAPLQRLRDMLRTLGRGNVRYPAVVFLDRIDELTSGNRFSLASVEELLRCLYSLTRSSREPLLSIVVGGRDDGVLAAQTFSTTGGAIANPLWRSWPVHYLRPLDRHESDELLQMLGTRVGMDFNGDALAIAFEKCGGHRYLTRALGSMLSESIGRDRAVRFEDVSGCASRLAVHWDEYMEAVFARAPEETRHALMRLVQGTAGEAELLGIASGFNPRRGALATLRFLVDYGFVERNGGNYELRVGILGDWLRARGFVNGPGAGSTPPPRESEAPARPSYMRVSPEALRNVVPNQTIVGLGIGPHPNAMPSELERQRMKGEILQAYSTEEFVELVRNVASVPVAYFVSLEKPQPTQVAEFIDYCVRHGLYPTLLKQLRARHAAPFGTG